jgi:prevent-host-death family protein
MTRITRTSAKGKVRAGKRPGSRRGRWLLQDAKARFSELVRRAKSEGPQLVTVHGRDEVVVVSTEEFRRLKGELTGQALVDVMTGSPLGEVEIEQRGARLPVRDVRL